MNQTEFDEKQSGSDVCDLKTRDGLHTIFCDDFDEWVLCHLASGGTCEVCGGNASGGIVFEHSFNYNPHDRSGNASSVAYCEPCWNAVGP